MSYKTGSLMMDTMHDDDPFGASLLNGSQTLFGSSPSFDDPSDLLYGTSPLLAPSGSGPAVGAGCGSSVAGIPSSPPIMPMKGLQQQAQGCGAALLPPLDDTHGVGPGTTLGESHPGAFLNHMKVPQNAGNSNYFGNGSATRHGANARRRSPSPSESGSTDSEDFLSDADTAREMGAPGSTCNTPRTQHPMHMHAGVTKRERECSRTPPPPAPPMYVGATHDPKKQQQKNVQPALHLRGVVKHDNRGGGTLRMKKPMRNPEQHSPTAPALLSKAGNGAADTALTGLPVPTFVKTGVSVETGGGDSESDGSLVDEAFDSGMNMSPTTMSVPTAMNNGGGIHQRPPPPPIAANGQQPPPRRPQQQQPRPTYAASNAAYSQSIGTMGQMSNGVMPMSDASTMGMMSAVPRTSVPPPFPTHSMSNGTMSGSGATSAPAMNMRGALPPNGSTANGIHVSASGRVETEVVRKRRLARKAELARSSRRKKKQRLVDLEGEVSQLQDELEQAHHQRKLDLEIIAELRAENAAHAAAAAQQQHQHAAMSTEQHQHHQQQQRQQQQQQQQQAHEAAAKARAEQEAAAAARAQQQMQQQQETHVAKPLDAAIRAAMKAITGRTGTGANAAQMGALIDDFCGKLNEMGARVDEHVETLVDTPLVPLPVRFFEWAMSQNDAFFETKTSLWSQLFAKIGYSQKQMQSLLTFRERMKAQYTMHKEVNAHTAALRAKQRELYSAADTNFADIRNVFTQSQLAEFFAWCEANELCVNALMSASP